MTTGMIWDVIWDDLLDFAQPSGKYGLPLHHPQFLEWVGAPELQLRSSQLLDMDPGANCTWMYVS